MIRARMGIGGLAEVYASLEALPGRLDRYVVADGLKAGADVVRDAARISTEFDDATGRLRKSIRSRKSRQKARAWVFAGNDDAYWAFWTEYGTAYRVGQPYLQEAYMVHDSAMYTAMVDEMRRSFNDLGSRLISGGVFVTGDIRRLAALG